VVKTALSKALCWFVLSGCPVGWLPYPVGYPTGCFTGYLQLPVPVLVTVNRLKHHVFNRAKKIQKKFKKNPKKWQIRPLNVLSSRPFTFCTWVL
jgi:hypothetical protein